MTKDLLVPDIGDFEKVEIVEVLVKAGDEIKKNESLVTLESDKSSVEVPSTEDGIIKSVNVKVGDKVSKGHLLATLESLRTTEEKPKKILEEKLPLDTEKIIEEAENTLVLKKKVDEQKTLTQKEDSDQKELDEQKTITKKE